MFGFEPWKYSSDRRTMFSFEYARLARTLSAIITICTILKSLASCHGNCHRNGICTANGVCECFPGWSGNDCSLRVCPSGPAVAGIANNTNSAHIQVVCSGRGTCDFLSGSCDCFPGFHGSNCGHTFCMNNCNGRGSCMSLRSASSFYDGDAFNRITDYNQWDSDLFYGCRCDPGWGGADCSERICPSGTDPRISIENFEIVSLVCDCSPSCSGKFKLQSLGQKASTWLTASSYASDLVNSLVSIPTFYGVSSVDAVIADVSNSSSWRLCRDDSSTRTIVKIKRGIANLPSLSFYANLLTGGSLYFEANQTLRCDCMGSNSCNGTIRVSFVGEVSSRISTSTNVRNLVVALNSMVTMKSAHIGVKSFSYESICISGGVSNHTLVFNSSRSNIPKIGLWISLLEKEHPNFYSSTNSSKNIISFENHESESFKLCNGVGTCDFSSGVCTCPYGWGSDSTLGPCGKLLTNTSRWGGIGRCPGIVDPGDLYSDLTGKQNYQTRLFISMNPSFKEVEGSSRNFSSNRTISSIEYYSWSEGSYPPWPGPHVVEATRTLFLNMSSNVSAGPIVVDEGGGFLFFIDLNPAGPFIGRSLLSERNGFYNVWLRLNASVFGLTMDAHFSRRRLYWTAPGSSFVADGIIFWASLDSEPEALFYTLNAAVGYEFIIDPMGIAVHYEEQRIYWVDKNISTDGSTTCLRSCNFDGSDYSQVLIYRVVDNVTVSVNATDLIIDFYHNNTAFFLDKSEPNAIITTNLDYPMFNSTGVAYPFFEDMHEVRAITNTLLTSAGSPTYLAIDDWADLLLWSDLSAEEVKFLRFISKSADPYNPGVVYKPFPSLSGSCANSYSLPVGLAFDRGLGRPSWGPYLDCYGNGKCSGLHGHWLCDCVKGASGNCATRNCPRGPAWWEKPVVDNIAHDSLVECSNMGSCDRFSGECACRPGFEGSACNRMSCQGQGNGYSSCSGRGRCLSMRELAQKRIDDSRDPSPLVYGSRPHHASTWDADMIFGCYGDVYGFSPATGFSNITSYVGQRLDEIGCPVGYNIRLSDYGVNVSAVGNSTTLQREVQALSCTGTSGFFSFDFRGVSSLAIPANSSAQSLSAILWSLSTLGQVDLELLDSSNSDTICSSSGQITNITFVSQLGKVPLLQVSENYIDGGTGSIKIWRVQESKGVLDECAGTGYCDRSTGQCSCWPRYGSSDGFGRRGTRGDCAHNLIY